MVAENPQSFGRELFSEFGNVSIARICNKHAGNTDNKLCGAEVKYVNIIQRDARTGAAE